MGGVILVLGGTAEGREVAQALLNRGTSAMLSLAGRTSQPLTVGPVRSGGFGGAAGLAAYLRSAGVRAVVDTTHPFAEAMTHHALLACNEVGVPLLRLARPGWSEHGLAGQWHWVNGHADAVVAVSELEGPILLTVGRQHTLDYAERLGDRRVVARVAEPPSGALPPRWVLLCARGPFTPEGERQLLSEHNINVVVTKDSGGSLTEAKLHAAAERQAAVVMIRRPKTPEGITVVSTTAQVLDWLL